MSDYLDYQVKIVVAKFLEVAYSKDRGVTTNIVMGRGPIEFRIDQDRNVTLSGGVGPILRFDGSLALNVITAKIKRISINFYDPRRNGMDVRYKVTLDILVGEVSHEGRFDITSAIAFIPGVDKVIENTGPARNRYIDRVVDEAQGF